MWVYLIKSITYDVIKNIKNNDVTNIISSSQNTGCSRKNTQGLFISYSLLELLSLNVQKKLVSF